MYETAVNKGKKQVKYIEAIGINWAKKGIKTREEALTESQDYNTAYLLVRKAFGFKRSLAPAETTIVDPNGVSTILTAPSWKKPASALFCRQAKQISITPAAS